ncbi:cyclic pyranopterin monophosphate synthase MoaC [Parvularcula marina]|uniref:cyclic pyranopterin monophosphate synthase MoaC n=1 Tax=Parvularcula marina TaxID=2292771 RepID=UPI003513CB02
MTKDLTHFDSEGRPRMVDVTAKEETARRAVAQGSVRFSQAAFDLVSREGVRKGDIRRIAELAGVMGAKKTAELIPLCHPLPISGVDVQVEPDSSLPGYKVTASVKTTGRTGVEMEALTAVSVACLTIYDMAKAVDKRIEIGSIQLVEKSGGKSGDYRCTDKASS